MRWLVAIPLVLIGLLAVACGSDRAANDVVGPLFVYMDGAWRSDRLLGIVTYDLGAQTQLFSFRPDGTSLSTEAVLDGDKVIVNQGSQLVQFDLDGTHPHVLYETPEGSEIVGIAVSPDTSKLAITEMTPYDPDAPQNWLDLNSVTFLDLPSGKEILAVPQSDPRFGDFAGFVWKITWRDDGKGIVVQGNTESGRPGGTATVMLDGSVYGETYQDFVRVAPNGR